MKLNPVTLMKNPVIFVVEVGAALVLLFLVRDIATGAGGIGFELQIDLWLWFTVLFATFAEAMAEARGKAQADSLRKTRSDTIANRLAGRRAAREGLVVEAAGRRRRRLQRGRDHPRRRRGHRGDRDGRRVGDHRRERAGHPRVGRRSQRRDRRHAGPVGSRSQIKITSNPGETFLDRMIALVEGAERQKTPNEIALNILIAGLTIIFLFAVVDAGAVRDLQRHVGWRRHGADDRRLHGPARLPDSDDDRRPAVGDRHRRHGPRDAAQRAGDERQGGRGRRRRQHAAAGQDRHHHAGQPPGGGVPAGRPASPKARLPTPRSCRAWPTRRRKGGRSSSSRRRSTACAAATSPRTTRSSSRSPPTRR